MKKKERTYVYVKKEETFKKELVKISHDGFGMSL